MYIICFNFKWSCHNLGSWTSHETHPKTQNILCPFTAKQKDRAISKWSFSSNCKRFLTFCRNENVFRVRSKMIYFRQCKESGGKSEKNEFPRKLMTMQLVAIVYFSGNMWKSANLSFEHIRCGNECCVLYVVYGYGCVRVLHIGCSKHGYIIHVVMLLWPRSSRNMIELKSRWHNCALFQLYWFRSFD